MTEAHAGWSAGAVLLSFPIASGTPLGGYVARAEPATGTLDRLTIGVLALEHEGNRVVIVAADVVAVDAELVDEIATAAGLDRAELALCASHTHSGPAGIVARIHPADPDRLDPELRSRFVATATEAIATARSGMETVNVLTGVAATDGVAGNRNDVAGPHDARLSLLATRRQNGSLQAVMVHFACHPTILGADNHAVSADFPGALRRALTTSLAQDDRAPVVLFVNGAAGDVSTRFTRRAQNFAEVERVGASLARTTLNALGHARSLDGPIRRAQATVSLWPRRRQTPDVEETVSRRADCENQHDPSSAGQRRVAETKAQGAAMRSALSVLPEEAIASGLQLDAWALGDLVLVTIPGELLASLGLAIGAAAPEKTLILGYANGYVGYLADRAAYETETYEALASPFAPGTGEHVAAAAAALIVRLLPGAETP